MNISKHEGLRQLSITAYHEKYLQIEVQRIKIKSCCIFLLRMRISLISMLKACVCVDTQVISKALAARFPAVTLKTDCNIFIMEAFHPKIKINMKKIQLSYICFQWLTFVMYSSRRKLFTCYINNE